MDMDLSPKVAQELYGGAGGSYHAWSSDELPMLRQGNIGAGKLFLNKNGLALPRYSGKYIDCHLHPDEYNRHSRLWIDKEIEDILANNLINEAIRCIKLSPQRLDLRTFMAGLRNMKKLRVLYMCSGSYWDDGRVSQLFPNSLRYLCWRAYPFSFLHETFQADNLVGLDMSFSPILKVWKVGNGKALTKLRFLDLSHTSLRRLNLGLIPNLERLDLTDCWNLVEINSPVGCLKNLLYLDLSGSGRFKSFLFDKQPKSPKVGSLSELHLIVESKDKCALHPYSNLPKYTFTCLYKEDQAASSFGNLEKLISIGVCACTNLESFSRSVCSLKCLRKLTLEGTIMEVPKNLHHLLYLEELILSSTNIKHLPDSVCLLKQLKSLKLQGCGHLEMLPEGFGQLECLKELNITDTAISHLPQCIFGLKGVRIIGSKMMLESFGFTFEIRSSDHETFVDITGAPKQESPVSVRTEKRKTIPLTINRDKNNVGATRQARWPRPRRRRMTPHQKLTWLNLLKAKCIT